MIPVSITVAITKYRLYDIDVVISRTVTYGVLAAFITGVYTLVVVGIGSILGSRDEQNLLLSVTAVAVVAVVFDPLTGEGAALGEQACVRGAGDALRDPIESDITSRGSGQLRIGVGGSYPARGGRDWR